MAPNFQGNVSNQLPPRVRPTLDQIPHALFSNAFQLSFLPRVCSNSSAVWSGEVYCDGLLLGTLMVEKGLPFSDPLLV